MTLGRYLPIDSYVHRLDPRVKLFLMALGIGVAFQVDTLPAMAGFFVFMVAATRCGQVSFRLLIKGLTPFIWLFGFTAVLHFFMTPGDAVSWLPYASVQGIQQGLQVAFQLIFAIWISTLMTLTTSPLDMVWALEWYLAPLKLVKVPVDEIALMVMLAIRFIPILFDETDRIIKAQKARGVDIETGSVLKKIRSLVPVIVPLLHGVFRRADDLAVALTLRGYEPGIKRGRYKVIRADLQDVLTLIATTIVFLALVWF